MSMMKNVVISLMLLQSISFAAVEGSSLVVNSISAPGSMYSMDTIKSKAQWVKTKASRVKEKTLDRVHRN